ncbi:hypothetical protein ACFX2J_033983 [Malus domestica]
MPPKKILRDIEQRVQKFLWFGKLSGHCVAKVAWDDVCLTKSDGGLGIKKLIDWNRALMVRNIWNLLIDEDNVWYVWARIYLLRNMNFWQIKIPQNCSWNWRKLLRLRDFVRLSFFHKIGDGRGTSIWYDNWHPLGPLVVNWGCHIIVDSRLSKIALVCNIWNGSNWCWPNNSSHELLEIQISMSNIVPNRSLGDMIRWTPSSSGILCCFCLG